MPWTYVTLITPTNEINVNGKAINIHKIDIIKIDEHGGLTFMEKNENYKSEPQELIEDKPA